MKGALDCKQWNSSVNNDRGRFWVLGPWAEDALGPTFHHPSHIAAAMGGKGGS